MKNQRGIRHRDMESLFASGGYLVKGRAPYGVYVDEEGNPIERTPQTHPYSYGTFVQWQHPQIPKEQAGGGWYSDRMFQHDHKKYNRAAQEVWGNQGQYFSQRTPEDIERFLRLYMEDDSLVLVTILQMCNVSSGYPLWYFRWETTQKGEVAGE